MSGLSQNSLTKPRRHRNGWTPERRARQSRAIRAWRPWTRSTGPRTAEGQARVRYNFTKNNPHAAVMARIRCLLNEQRLFLRRVGLRYNLLVLGDKERNARARLLDCRNYKQIQRLNDQLMRIGLRRLKLLSHPLLAGDAHG